MGRRQGRKKEQRKKAKSYLLDPVYDEVAEALADAQRAIRKGDMKLTDEIKGTGYAAWTGGVTYASHNHPGDKVIYTSTTGKELYASNQPSIDIYSDRWGLIIDLAGIITDWDLKRGFVKKCAEKYDILRKFCSTKEVKAEVLKLDWPDYQAPTNIPLAFWCKLWELVPERSVIACQGGHGRTGTCIAALMIADGMDYYSAVMNVRTEHCAKAIESLGQEEYLHSLYLEMLKVDASLEHTPEELQSIQNEITYAKAHLPNKHSSYGEDKPRPKGESLKKNLGTLYSTDNKIDYGTKFHAPKKKAVKYKAYQCEKCQYISYVESYATQMRCTNPDKGLKCKGWMDPVQDNTGKLPMTGLFGSTPITTNHASQVVTKYFWDKLMGMVKVESRAENKKYYLKECINPDCNRNACDITAHLNWVEWTNFDPVQWNTSEWQPLDT